MSKKAASIDMTAMCDVAFLLLTFFILTATAKVPEALPVDTPQSTNSAKLPTSDLAIITIGKGKGVVFYDLKGREVRKRALELMGQKYGVTFTEDTAATVDKALVVVAFKKSRGHVWHLFHPVFLQQ